MGRLWTFRRKIAIGFAITVLLTIAIGGTAIWSLKKVVASKDRVITVNGPILVDTEKLRELNEARSSADRGYLLTGDASFLSQFAGIQTALSALIERLNGEVHTDGERQSMQSIVQLEGEHTEALTRVMDLRRATSNPQVVSRAFNTQVVPVRAQLEASITDFETREQQLLDSGRESASATAASAIYFVIAMSAGVVIFAVLIALILTRTLGRQIGTAVSQIRSSSAELQTSANQQAMSVKEQATAMSEITTTINELLATSRQIAESAQRVAQIAEQTAGAARSGQGTVETARESIGGIRRQVDLVVSHMLELGRKSQQIGAILDIVSEVAEQTNILAINATIEAAGAGDAGRRFGVIADEIRKLADRVSGSTNEIRGLIDDVRSAVNTTVMATETGSKAVDTGSTQFGEVATSFKQIADLIATTTEASREIELSTKQQTTAVEQVNVAVANVAQATKESETSVGQTFQTASQLASLSGDLMRLVQPATEA